MQKKGAAVGAQLEMARRLRVGELLVDARWVVTARWVWQNLACDSKEVVRLGDDGEEE